MESSSKRVFLPDSEHPSPNTAAIRKTDPAKIVSVSIIVKRKQALDMKALGGRILSHAEFDQQYAADPASFDRLRAFATAHGLKVDDAASSLERRTLVLTGTVEAMESAFGVQLHTYAIPDSTADDPTAAKIAGEDAQTRDFHCFNGLISLPIEIAGDVDAVLGLDNRPVAVSHIRFLDSSQQAVTQSFTPPQIAQLYNFPTDVNGAGQSIGILELGGGYQTTDIDQYFKGLGLTPPSVTAVPVAGGTNAPGNPQGADGEVALDIQVAGAIAPGAKIAVYFAPNTDQGFQAALTTAIHDASNNPNVISISWGGPESGWSQQAMTAFDDACQSAAALGITITAASGDNGSSDGVSDGTDHVDFPASSPHVLACGGTQLAASGTSVSSESAWNDQGNGGGATGGGVSSVFTLPGWQATSNVPAPAAQTGGRGVPDVAGDAAPSTGYQILVDGQQQVVGGTSAVAPLWAALVALLNQKLGKPLGFLNPRLYQGGEAGFNDIINGNNGDFTCAQGWDPCTGLGSPDGAKLLQSLGGS